MYYRIPMQMWDRVRALSPYQQKILDKVLSYGQSELTEKQVLQIIKIVKENAQYDNQRTC